MMAIGSAGARLIAVDLPGIGGSAGVGIDGTKAENIRPHRPITTPTLCVRGDGERGDVGAYADGLRASGVVNVSTAVIADAGRFTQEEQPERTWAAIAAFALGS